MIVKYNKFIKLVRESSINEVIEKISDKFKDLKLVIIQMIEKSLNTSDGKTFEDFIDAYIKNSDDTKIEGLINDAEIYEFYLKYRNEVDEILSEINFYDQKPSELNVFGVYDYIIKSTNSAISEIVKMIHFDISDANK